MDEDAICESKLIEDKKPNVGMEFSSIDEAYVFYNQYAKEVGFSVRKDRSSYRKDTKEIMNKYLVCSKEGTSLAKGTKKNRVIDREQCNDSWWERVIQKTNTVGNAWLESIFELRSKWVPAYCNDVFSAGMASSQRVEGAHAFFKNYVARQNSLMEFIIRFNRAVTRQRNRELEKNHIDLTTRPSLKSVMAMEGQMASIYTRTVFLKFQSELSNMLACLLKHVSEDEHKILYIVVERNEDGSYKERTISYDKALNFASCSCRKFQAEGIPCKHLLAYLRMVAQQEYLPEVYIRKRWTKGADSDIRVDVHESSIHGVIDKSLIMNKSKLSKLSSQLIDLALVSDSATESLYHFFEKKIKKVKEMVGATGVENSVVQSRCCESASGKDPIPIRGLGSGKRLKSPKELATQTSKRHCTLCGKVGHDKRKCTVPCK